MSIPWNLGDNQACSVVYIIPGLLKRLVQELNAGTVDLPQQSEMTILSPCDNHTD